MIAGRGLGHTGGTIDKLETIPGFRCDLSIEAFEKQVKEIGLALIGQTSEICPADKKIYALRDVTATIESLPLICASIMSKKIAEGIQGLVLDVKWGSGAFMKTVEEASELADRLCAIGRIGGKKVAAVVSNMNQPLGRFIGNALEIEECVAILRREEMRGRKLSELADCEALSVELAGIMIWLGNKAETPEAGVAKACTLLESGEAYVKFEELVKRQGGKLSELPRAVPLRDVFSQNAGYVNSIETEQVGYAALLMGAGRQVSSDVINPLAGIEALVRLGDRVDAGQPLYRLYGAENAASGVNSPLQTAADRLIAATRIEPALDKSLPSSGASDLIALRKY
jgi:pyrimidine-nucleoside phosphorylase